MADSAMEELQRIIADSEKSQAELAGALGIERTDLNKRLNRRVRFSLKEIERLGGELNLSSEMLQRLLDELDPPIGRRRHTDHAPPTDPIEGPYQLAKLHYESGMCAYDAGQLDLASKQFQRGEQLLLRDEAHRLRVPNAPQEIELLTNILTFLAILILAKDASEAVPVLTAPYLTLMALVNQAGNKQVMMRISDIEADALKVAHRHEEAIPLFEKCVDLADPYLRKIYLRTYAVSAGAATNPLILGEVDSLFQRRRDELGLEYAAYALEGFATAHFHRGDFLAAAQALREGQNDYEAARLEGPVAEHIGFSLERTALHFALNKVPGFKDQSQEDIIKTAEHLAKKGKRIGKQRAAKRLEQIVEELTGQMANESKSEKDRPG